MSTSLNKKYNRLKEGFYKINNSIRIMTVLL